MARVHRPLADRVALVAGLGVSVALHGILLLLAQASRPPAAPRAAEPLAIELLEAPSPPAPLAVAPPERRQGAPKRRQPASGRGAEAAVGTAGPPSGPPVPAGRDPSARATELLRPAPSAPADLLVSVGYLARSSGLAPSQGDGGQGDAGQGGEYRVEAESEGARAQRRVQAMLDEARAEDQARTPDAYWSPVRNRMAERFVPSWAVFDGARGAPGARASSVGRVLAGYLDAAGRYGRASTAGGEDRAAPASALDREARPLDDRNPFRRDLVVLIRVAQRVDGTLERVELVESCGYRELDRMALDAARAAVEGNVAPTPAQGRRTVWAFTAQYEVIPPVPVIACPPDVIWTARFERCAWPLKRSATARVELRAVQ